MALLFAHGAVQWNTADVATTVYTITLGFRPKALRFSWLGLASAGIDAISQTVFSRRGQGFATATGDQRCVATQDQDATADSVCTTGYRTDCIAQTITSTPGADGRLRLNSVTATGFTLIVDDNSPVNITVFYDGWGGDDIQYATTGEIVEPAAPGNVDYVITGSFQPHVVMFAGVQATAAAPTAARGDSGFCVGFASGTTAAQNVVVVGNADDANVTMNTDGYCQTGECLAMITVAGGNPNARAMLTQWNPNGFRLNWIVAATANRKTIYMAIHGGRWRAGAYTIAGNVINSRARVGGLPFTPAGILTMGRMTAQNTVAVATVHDRIGLGTGTSILSRRSQGSLSEDATLAAEIDQTIQYDQVLSFPSITGTLLAAYDISLMDTNEFEVIVDLAGGVAAEWQGYLAFGSEPRNISDRFSGSRGSGRLSSGPDRGERRPGMFTPGGGNTRWP